MRRWSRGWLAVAILLAVAVAPTWPLLAQPEAPTEPAAEDLAGLSVDLEGIQRDLAQLRSDVEPGLEQRLQAIMQRSDRLSDDAQMRLARLQQQLTALGSAPRPQDPPEPPEIAAERIGAQRSLMELETQGRIASFLRVRAHQLLETVAARQRAAVLDIVLMETPPPWDPSVWRAAAADFMQILSWLRFSAVAWEEWYRVQGGLLALMQAIAAVAAGASLAAMATRWLGRRVAAAGRGGDAAVLRATSALRRAGIPCAALLALMLLWGAQGWLCGSFGAVLQRALVAAILVVLGITMLRAPAAAGYGMVRSETIGPWMLRGVALLLMALVIGLVKEAALRQPTPPPALLAVMATVCGVVALAFLAPLLRSSAWRKDDVGVGLVLTRATLAFIAIAPLAAALLGRGVLATYLYNRALAALVLVWAVAQFRRVVHTALRSALDEAPAEPQADGALEDGAADAPARIASYWAAALADIGLALLTLHILLQLLDMPQAQIDYWTGLALGDIQVGNAVISLPNIFLAILVLAAGLFGSSRLRRWLGKRVLPQSGMEIGLRTSIAAGAGYLGMVLAFLAAVATAGISLSSFAIVAGALSVGMGFGLRTVVENFVAGLLMLIERPIRVGDWVVIGDTEGTVRRISVRATEIETFDSASVIVPNSLFVSSPVTNWTLQNRRGRIHVKLGVAYDSDPKQVQDALLECARANRQIAAYPAP
jgi:potassium-dependent mechanosensitive channel